MKRFKRFAAIFLSAAMVMTSFQVPVFAETGEEIVVGQDDSGSAVEISAGAEEGSRGSAAEAPAEQEMPAEEVTGADSSVYVYSAAELVSALNGDLIAEDSKNPNDKLTADKLKADKVTLVLKARGSDSVEEDYILTEEQAAKLADLKGLAGREITVISERCGESWENKYVSVSLAEGVKSAKLVIPSDASLILENGLYNFGIENNGYFRGKNAEIDYAYGDSFVNNSKAKAEFDGGRVKSTAKLSTAIVNHSEAELVIGNNTGVQAVASNAAADIEPGSLTAIKNEGTLLLNGAKVEAENDTVSSCAIENTGSLSVRSAEITSAAVAIYNTGTAEIGSPLAQNESGSGEVFIENSALPSILTVAGGSVAVYNTGTQIGSNFDANIPAVATTDLFGNKERFTASGDGAFTMYGGTVYGIGYKGTNYPTLLGGTVMRSDGACVQYKKEEGKEPEPDKVEGCLYKDKDGQEQHAYENGKPKDRLSLDKEALELGNAESVSSQDELISALKGEKEEISIASGFAIVTPLQIDRKVKITGSYVTMQDGGKITVGKDGDVVWNVPVDIRYSQAGSAIENNGTLELQREICQQGNKGYPEITAVKNAGNLAVHGNSAVIEIYAGTGVDNTGRFELLDGYIKVQEDKTWDSENQTFRVTEHNSVAVKNSGEFIMKSGEVKAAQNNVNSYAIAYTGDKLPVLIAGSVYGSRYYNSKNAQESRNHNDYWRTKLFDFDENGVQVGIVPTRGAAVVQLTEAAGKPNEYKTGAFLDSEGGTAKSAKDSDSIINGIAQDMEILRPEVVIPDEYLLMEQGEELEDGEIRKMVANMAQAVNTAGGFYYRLLEVPAEQTNVVEAKMVGEASNAKGYIKALNPGYAVVTIELCDETGQAIVQNYIRIEVVKSREELFAKDYTGSILNPAVQYNGYRVDGASVGFEYHLADSELKTGAAVELEKLIEETYKVDEIRIEDKEFNEYFTLSSRGGKNFTYDPQSKLYSFNIIPLDEYGDGADSYSSSTKLLVDEITGIQDIEVSAVLRSQKNQKEKEIVVKIGTFDISVKSVAPKFPSKTITLNRFYDSDAAYDIDEAYDSPNYKWLANVSDVVCPAGIVYVSEDEDGGYITAAGKKGGKVTATIRDPKYVGKYPVTYTVKVVNKAPKVALKEKKISIYGKTAAEADILNYLTAKDAESVGMIKSIEVVETDKRKSQYKVSKTDSACPYVNEKNGKFAGYQYGFYLQPKEQNLTGLKNETVKLKVTWNNTRKVKGKPYSSELSLKIAAVDSSKFTIKQNGKASLNTTIEGVNKRDSASVQFDVTPKTFKGGKFVVTGLDGKTELDYLEFGKVTETGIPGRYQVQVAANSKTQGKAVKFGIRLIELGDDGKEKQLGKTAVMTVSLYTNSAIDVVKNTAQIDMGKIKYADIDKLYESLCESCKSEDGVLNEESFRYMVYKDQVRPKLTAGFKLKGSGDWMVQSDDSELFNVQKNAKGDSLEVYPTQNAFFAGKIEAGASYPIKVTLRNELGKTETKDITVQVKQVKKADVTLREIDDIRYDPQWEYDSNWNRVYYYGNTPYIQSTVKTSFTMYANSPYTLDSFIIADGVSSAPYYGLKVKEIEVEGTSPYEVIKFRGANGEQSQYALTFTGKKSPKLSSKKDLKNLESVKFKVTFTNGQSIITKPYKVNIADKDALGLR